MADAHHDPRTRPVPQNLIDLARRELTALGPRGAARRLGVSRGTVIAVAAGLDATAGTIALLREASASLHSVNP